MNQIPYYQPPFPSLNLLYSIPPNSANDNLIIKSYPNQNNYLYVQNPVISYLKTDDIHNSQKTISSNQQRGQNQKEYLSDQNFYNPNQICFLVPKKTFNPNQFPIQKNNPNFDVLNTYQNYSSNILTNNLTNNYIIQNKRWIQTTNKDDSTINTKSNTNHQGFNSGENNYSVNDHETNTSNSPIMNFNSTTHIPSMENLNDSSNFVPIPGALSYSHPPISIIPNTKGNTKTDFHIFLEQEYMKNIPKAINNRLEGKKVSKRNKSPIKIIAAFSPMWTSKDDKLLRDLKEKQKLSWRDISKFFPTRTINACQFRWRRLIIREKNKVDVKVNK